MKCWDAKAENRPTAKELYQKLKGWDNECGNGDYDKCDPNSEIYLQIKECDKIRESKFNNESNENKSTQRHPQAIYSSRLLNFKNLPEPVNLVNSVNSVISVISVNSVNSLDSLNSVNSLDSLIIQVIFNTYHCFI